MPNLKKQSGQSHLLLVALLSSLILLSALLLQNFTRFFGHKQIYYQQNTKAYYVLFNAAKKISNIYKNDLGCWIQNQNSIPKEIIFEDHIVQVSINTLSPQRPSDSSINLMTESKSGQLFSQNFVLINTCTVLCKNEVSNCLSYSSDFGLMRKTSSSQCDGSKNLGDLSLDGFIDFNDVFILKNYLRSGHKSSTSQFQSTDQIQGCADFNQDQATNDIDLSILTLYLRGYLNNLNLM